jgi:hypothetical protein
LSRKEARKGGPVEVAPLAIGSVTDDAAKSMLVDETGSPSRFVVRVTASSTGVAEASLT